MAKQIKRTDIVEDDIFKVTRESAQDTLEVLDKLNVEFKASAKILSEDIKKATLDSAKSIESFVKSTEKATKLKTDSIRVDEQTIKIKQQLAKLEEMEEKRRLAKEKADGQAISNAQKLQREEEKRVKASERAAKAAKDEASAYKQLEKNTRELKNQSKELAAQMLILEKNGQRNTKEYRNLAAEYKKVTAAAQQGDQALKKIDSTVGDNFRNVGNYSSAIGKLQNVLGQLGIAFGIGTVVRSAGQTILDFDQKIADLVSITGAGGKDLEFFKEQAIELGKATQGGASAVIEAYKLIGSAKPELLSNAEALNEVTKAAMTLSKASGMELPDAATALTDAMNQFGAPAEDAARFIDALANGALFGAAEIPQVTEALLRFGAVANTANVNVEESTALIEALAEKGLKGAEAGTALRNVMLKLSAPDALPKEAKKRLDELGISFADLQDTSKPFSERLDALKPLLNDNAALVKVFGTENAVAATNLIRNTDRIKELTASMYTQGTASKQAEDRSQTLGEALNTLKESWNALILSFNEGSGIGSAVASGIGFIAKNLSTILSVIGKLITAWAAYKAIQLSLLAIDKARNFSLAEFGKNLAAQIPMTKAYKQAQQEAAVATNAAGTAAKTTGNVMKSIPWVAIAGLVIELAMAFYDMASGADAAAEAQARLDKTVEASQKKAADRVTKRQSDLQKDIAALQDLRNEEKITEEQFLKRKQYAINLSQKQIQTDIKAVNERKKQNVSNIKDLERVQSQLKNNNSLNEEQIKILKKAGVISAAPKGRIEEIAIIGKLGDNIAQLKANVAGADAKIKEYRTELDQSTEATKRAASEVKALAASEENDTKKKEKKTKAVKELNTVMQDYNEYLTVQNELLAELEQLETEGKINQLTTEIEQMTSELQMLADEGISVDTSAVESKIEERYNLEKQLIQQKLDAEIAAINERYRIEAEKAREAVTEDYKKLISQKGLSTEERLKIEKQYQEQLALLDQDELQRNADKELELKIAKEKASQDQIGIEKSYNEEVDNLKNDLNDRILNKEEEKRNNDEEARKKELEKEKQNADDRIAIINAIAEAAIEASKKRVELIEKEIQAAQTQADYLRELAAQGNINAKESLAEQNKIIADAERRKQEELKRQERIQFANTVFQTYQKNASDDSVKNPLAKTISDVTLLTQFIKAFPAFLDGTEDTGVNGQGVDGKGGFHAILHPNERVMTKEQNSMVGGLSNESLAKLAQEYNAGNVIHKSEGASQIGGAWSTVAVIKKLDELENAIKSKPETNIELGEIIDGAMTIIKSKKQGNSIVYNRYKVK